MTGIFATRSNGYVNVPLLSGEQILRQQEGGYMRGGATLVGGKVVVTNQRLLFRPISIGVINKLVQDGIEMLPDRLAQIGKLVSKVLDYADTYTKGLAGAIPVAMITSANPGNRSSMVLSVDSGRQTNLAIAASFWSRIWDVKKNDSARDEMIALIRSVLPR